MAVNWRGTKVADMTPEQKEAYERDKEKARVRRQKRVAEQRSKAQDEAIVERTDFAKQQHAAMKKYDLPFEQYFTQELANRILMWITCGGDLADVCKERGVPEYPVVMQWVRPYLPVSESLDEDTVAALEYFRACYIEARKNKLEKELDEIIRISDQATNKENSAAAKVRVQARVIMLERINVQLFAPATKSLQDNEDKNDLKDSFVAALEEVAAKRRARLGSAEDKDVVDIQVVKSLGDKDALGAVDVETQPHHRVDAE